MSDAPPDMRNSLRAERSARGVTQARAAEWGGISRQSYAAIESGRTVPSTEVALRLARAFGRPVEELFHLGDPSVEPVLARWVGADPAEGRRVRLATVAGRLHAYALGEEYRPMRPADGVVTRRLEREVEVRPLAGRPSAAELVVVGCDPAFGVVSQAMLVERGVEVFWSHGGSRAALEALAAGAAHVAGVHLRDPVTGEYNGPWVEKLVPFPCTRISFALWEQGLVLAPGNPKGVGSVEDLPRPGLRFLNREPGSGSRALLDDRLRKAGVPAERIVGYETGARGHMAVAEGVASGLADAGIGIRAAAAAHGLSFLPLETERYELVVPDHFLDLPAVQALVRTLGRPAVRSQVEALGGYDAEAMGRPA